MLSDSYVTTDSVVYFVIEMIEMREILDFMLRHR